MTTQISGILDSKKYEWRGGALTPLSVANHRERMTGMGTVRIPLSSRKYPNLYAIIDEEDYELVNQYRWHPWKPDDRRAYASAGRHGPKMHRLIMDAPSGVLVDHINHDGLDNRRCNLRLADHFGNAQNAMMQVTNRTGLKGVYPMRSGWQAKIDVGHTRVHLGTYTTREAAASAYDHAAIEYHGEFASTNVSLGLLLPADLISENNLQSYRNTSASTYRGVLWEKRRSKWIASVTVNRRPKYVGQFDSEIEAAKAYDAAALKFLGASARLNFPAVASATKDGK